MSMENEEKQEEKPPEKPKEPKSSKPVNRDFLKYGEAPQMIDRDEIYVHP